MTVNAPWYKDDEDFDRIAKINSELLEILAELFSEYDEERQVINVSPDAGCFECTAGTVPNHLNTGLCAMHRARTAILKATGGP